MVVDTSALVAIFLKEAEHRAFSVLIDRAPLARISAVARVELFSVLCGRRFGASRSAVSDFIESVRLEHMAVTVEQMEEATNALLAFGLGRHPARLNLGDCFSYALARTLGDTLLFKGGDFALTDIEPAWRLEEAAR